jgi:hypothetical protein
MQGSLACLCFLSGAIALASCSQSSERFTDHKSTSTETVALFKVRVGDKFGYIDKTGRVTIPPQFDIAKPFSEGLAAVLVGDKWGYIDQTGRFAVNPRFFRAHAFSNGLALVNEGDYSHLSGPNVYINKRGEVVITPDQVAKGLGTSARVGFDFDLSDFAEGLAVIIDGNGKSGYIDTAGRIAIAPQFDIAFFFHDGLAEIKMFSTERYEGRELIDKSGRIVLGPLKLCPELFTGPVYFSEGYAGAMTEECFGNWGYIDKSGKFAIEPRFRATGPFSEDLAMVGFETLGAHASIRGNNISSAVAKFGDGSYDEPDLKFGFIHKSGVLVIPARFEGGGMFSEGLAAVQLKGKCGYIDKAGHLVIPAIFDAAHPFSDGLAEVAIGEKWSYIDKSGAYVWKAP